MAGLGVAELVEEELTRFTHKLNCFDGSVSLSWCHSTGYVRKQTSE